MINESWYAVFVKTGEEDNVKERLQYKLKDSFKFFVPKRKLKERKQGIWKINTRVLFPGYVLIKGILDDDLYYDFKEVPGVVHFLKSETKILKIHDEEIEVLSRLICNGDTIGFSTLFIKGSKVQILDGPLMDLEGIIKKLDKRKGRAKVSLSFMGEDRTVDLGISILKPVEN